MYLVMLFRIVVGFNFFLLSVFFFDTTNFASQSRFLYLNGVQQLELSSALSKNLVKSIESVWLTFANVVK